MDNNEMEGYEQAYREAELRAGEARLHNIQNGFYQEEPKEKSMIEQQLNLGEELDRIDYLLRGYAIERDEETGNSKWVKPTQNEMIILSDYGVHLIRNTIAWYLNKNTLLSNYDEETINHKMEDFSSDLNDTIFMEYEKIFQYPSFNDCKQILTARIKHRQEIKIYALELVGNKLSEIEKENINEKIIEELEPIIERELEKIKAQIIKDKLKRFLIIIREIQDAVHSTYLRAWKGQERTTLRQHIHISESKGNMFMPQQNKTGSPLDFFKRK